jgi:hypothetical protein
MIILDRIFEKKDLYEETGTEATTWVLILAGYD